MSDTTPTESHPGTHSVDLRKRYHEVQVDSSPPDKERKRYIKMSDEDDIKFRSHLGRKKKFTIVPSSDKLMLGIDHRMIRHLFSRVEINLTLTHNLNLQTLTNYSLIACLS